MSIEVDQVLETEKSEFQVSNENFNLYNNYSNSLLLIIF